MTLLFSVAAYGDDDVEDDMPDVTARVSRISFIRGDVKIKREGSQDWEKAVLNLPVVKGDEIITDGDGRLEIQLNIYSHVRIAENSYLKILGHEDGSVALSLSEGSMNVRLTEFDKDKASFEIDAPKTTVAIQKSGMYRIDAGKPGAAEVRVTATENGEARVYSENSGFTLHNNRAASLKIDGPLAGEWETVAALQTYDGFDEWAVQRNETIAKRIRDAYYDKYYDRDIYGAEDLNDNGEWVYTRKYGHVWRPFRSSITQYANWTPYRYGHWRWVPPYGWTWINDEPWGWATYHHGRWFYDDGYWNWSPYGQIRRSRSWWFPALIGVTIVRNSICWYPLPRGYGYYNYNYYFGGWGGPRGGHNGGPRGGGHNNGNGNGNGGPVATPTPPKYVGPLPGQLGPSVFTDNNSRRAWFLTPPLLRVPPGAVVSTPLSSFGRDTEGIATVSPTDARIVLTKALAQNEQVRILPTYQELDGRVKASIKSEKPLRSAIATAKPTGAAVRSADAGPMDRTLRSTKIYGDRDPIKQEIRTEREIETRKTGAVSRDPIRSSSGGGTVRPERSTQTSKPDRADPIRAEPVYTQPAKPRDRGPDPIRVEPKREETQKPRNEPVRQPRYDPPPTRSEPVRSAPVRNEPIRSEPPRKSDPHPTRSEPSKSDTKQAPVKLKSKDN